MLLWLFEISSLSLSLSPRFRPCLPSPLSQQHPTLHSKPEGDRQPAEAHPAIKNNRMLGRLPLDGEILELYIKIRNWIARIFWTFTIAWAGWIFLQFIAGSENVQHAEEWPQCWTTGQLGMFLPSKPYIRPKGFVQKCKNAALCLL